MLTDELFKANETISFLSSLTGQNPDLVKANLAKIGDKPSPQKGKNLVRQDSEITQKKDGTEGESHRLMTEIEKEKFFAQNAPADSVSQAAYSRRIGTAETANGPNNAANETKDAITGRIIHTVNMMKEVLQGNLGLRETIQKQSELIDEQNGEIF